MNLFNVPKLVRKYIGKITRNGAKANGVSEENATLIIKLIKGQTHVWLYDGQRQVKELSEEELMTYATSD